MRFTKVGTPVTSSDGENAQLGDDDGGTDSSCDFLGGLDTETNVALGVTDNDDGLETGTLTGTGLLLDGFDLEVDNTHKGQHLRWKSVSLSTPMASASIAIHRMPMYIVSIPAVV